MKTEIKKENSWTKEVMSNASTSKDKEIREENNATSKPGRERFLK